MSLALFLILKIDSINISVLPSCMSLHHCLQRPEETAGFSGDGVTGGCDQPRGLGPGPAGERPVFLTTELSLQPQTAASVRPLPVHPNRAMQMTTSLSGTEMGSLFKFKPWYKGVATQITELSERTQLNDSTETDFYDRTAIFLSRRDQ